MTGSQDSTKDDDNPVVEHTSGAAPPGAQFPFDVVVVEDESGERNLSPSEFFALPLAHRIRYVVQQKASFFAKGCVVDSREVLGHMRKMRANLH